MIRLNSLKDISIISKLSVNDSVDASLAYQSNVLHSAGVGSLIPELLPIRNQWHMIMAIFIHLVIGGILATILIEFDWVYIRPSAKELNFFQENWIHLLSPGLPMLLSLYLIKHFCGIRYLLFQGDKAILQGRWDGRRVYEAKDLKLHLLSDYPDGESHCTLEIELPDLSLSRQKRFFKVESTPNKQLMEGILHGLLPLLRGDPSIAQQAKPRPYLGVPKIKGLALFRRLINFDSYVCIWIADYKINQILFWLVHGGPKKVLSLPINQKKEDQ